MSLFKCPIIIKKFHPCLATFGSKEELDFHMSHTCIHNEEQTLLCQEFSHVGCIAKLKNKITDPILFPCYDCKKNHETLFKLDYHQQHNCPKIVYFSYYQHCPKFFKTGSCKCSTKIERHQRKKIFNNAFFNWWINMSIG